MLVEYEGAMAKSTDQRIQRILRNKAKEKEADDFEKKLAKDRSNERQETADRVRQKWTADTYIIAEILKDFEQKMSALELQLAFQDAGQKGDALAVGHISGRVPQVICKLHSTSIPRAKSTPFRDRSPDIFRANLLARLNSRC